MGYQHPRTIAIIGMLVLAASCRPEPSPPILWQASLPLALGAARQQGKPVFLYVTAAWCSICRRVERDSFGNPDTVSALGRFVPVMVDIDQYPWVGLRYDVAAVPAFLVLDSRGRVLSRAFGFQGPDDIKALLQASAGEAPARE